MHARARPSRALPMAAGWITLVLMVGPSLASASMQQQKPPAMPPTSSSSKLPGATAPPSRGSAAMLKAAQPVPAAAAQQPPAAAVAAATTAATASAAKAVPLSQPQAIPPASRPASTASGAAVSAAPVAPADAAVVEQPADSVYGVLTSDNGLDLFRGWLTALRLNASLLHAMPLTILAPTNQAIQDFYTSMNMTADQVQQRPELIDTLVSYTILPLVASNTSLADLNLSTNPDQPTLARSLQPSYTVALWTQEANTTTGNDTAAAAAQGSSNSNAPVVRVSDAQGNVVEVTGPGLVAGNVTVFRVGRVLLNGDVFTSPAAFFDFYPRFSLFASSVGGLPPINTSLANNTFNDTLMVVRNSQLQEYLTNATAQGAAGSMALGDVLQNHLVQGYRPLPTGWNSSQWHPTALKGHRLGINSTSIEANLTDTNVAASLAAANTTSATPPATYSWRLASHTILPEPGSASAPAPVTLINIFTGQGVIHAVDGVLLPAGSKVAPQAARSKGPAVVRRAVKKGAAATKAVRRTVTSPGRRPPAKPVTAPVPRRPPVPAPAPKAPAVAAPAVRPAAAVRPPLPPAAAKPAAVPAAAAAVVAAAAAAGVRPAALSSPALARPPVTAAAAAVTPQAAVPAKPAAPATPAASAVPAVPAKPAVAAVPAVAAKPATGPVTTAGAGAAPGVPPMTATTVPAGRRLLQAVAVGHSRALLDVTALSAVPPGALPAAAPGTELPKALPSQQAAPRVEPPRPAASLTQPQAAAATAAAAGGGSGVPQPGLLTLQPRPAATNPRAAPMQPVVGAEGEVQPVYGVYYQGGAGFSAAVNNRRQDSVYSRVPDFTSEPSNTAHALKLGQATAAAAALSAGWGNNWPRQVNASEADAAANATGAAPAANSQDAAAANKPAAGQEAAAANAAAAQAPSAASAPAAAPVPYPYPEVPEAFYSDYVPVTPTPGAVPGPGAQPAPTPQGQVPPQAPAAPTTNTTGQPGSNVTAPVASCLNCGPPPPTPTPDSMVQQQQVPLSQPQQETQPAVQPPQQLQLQAAVQPQLQPQPAVQPPQQLQPQAAVQPPQQLQPQPEQLPQLQPQQLPQLLPQPQLQPQQQPQP